MHYEHFRKRAESYRRSAYGANAWLADVSLDLADMFDAMAEDALTLELNRRGKAMRLAAGSRSYRSSQPAAPPPQRWRPSLSWIGFGRWRGTPECI